MNFVGNNKLANIWGKNGAQIKWRVKLHILEVLGSLSISIKNLQGANFTDGTVGGPGCTFSLIQIQTERVPPLPLQPFCNFQIPATTVDEIVPDQLELKEDIQANVQVPTLHREVAEAWRKSSLITPLLQLPPLMNPRGTSADFPTFRQSFGARPPLQHS